MTTHTFQSGDVKITVECPEDLTPDVDVWFHRTTNDTEAVVKAFGGIGKFDPIKDTGRGSLTIGAPGGEPFNDGGFCTVYVPVPEAPARPNPALAPYLARQRREREEQAA